MHKHQIQSLKNRVHPIFEYSDLGDPTRESADELPEGEIQDRVVSIVAHNVEVDMGRHPQMFKLNNLPNLVSPSLCFSILEHFLLELQ
ncbi:hypothetical protein BAE44_0007496 [Dichanthelium oligosanthes]|uniref:Uncharacterized protein n=1 Tax=Dichanthelium oligosanthes TaxID=888268 RepID=A0A1E5W242_9POAL|nr:hypothetical protein BAE44_0007496 [Dichanthelium oligosanthes]